MVNARLEEGREKRKKFLAGQSDKGKKSAEKRTKNKPNINHSSTTVQQGNNHLKTEYENEIEKENENIEGGMGEDLDESQFLIEPDLPLPDSTLEATQRNQFALTRSKNTDFIREQWFVFLSERIQDPPEKRLQYRRLSDLTSYFLNWIRNKHPKNGSHQKSTSSGNNKPGTSEARVQAAKDY